tara:strand:- start:9657 stop:10241 length:585 start_codon:yes stop_codon:yes gene_type:complete
MDKALLEFIRREINTAKKTKTFLLEAPESQAAMAQPGMEDLADSIQSMVQGLSLEEVSELFSVVFSGLEGGAEQMKSYEEPDQSPEPETLYVPGAEGRPQMGFREELIRTIKEVLEEGLDDYHDFMDPVSMVTGDSGPASMGDEELNELEGAREFADVFHEKYNDHQDPALGSASDAAYEMSLSLEQFFSGTKS